MQNPFVKKSDAHLNINLWLFSVSFTIFALLISLNTKLLQNVLFSFQLVAAIPLFFSSILSRSKIHGARNPKLWDDFGYATSLLGYSFLVNVVGNLFAFHVSRTGGHLFFGLNIILALLYSYIAVQENPNSLYTRFWKDAFFISILFIGGIFPALGAY